MALDLLRSDPQSTTAGTPLNTGVAKETGTNKRKEKHIKHMMNKKLKT